MTNIATTVANAQASYHKDGEVSPKARESLDKLIRTAEAGDVTAFNEMVDGLHASLKKDLVDNGLKLSDAGKRIAYALGAFTGANPGKLIAELEGLGELSQKTLNCELRILKDSPSNRGSSYSIRDVVIEGTEPSKRPQDYRNATHAQMCDAIKPKV